MKLSQFLNLRIGSFIYNVKDKDIRRTASQFVEQRMDQYKETKAVMWTRPAFGDGYGRDIEWIDCVDWEPLPLDVWEVPDQEIINRFLTLQQRHILSLLEHLNFTTRRI